MKKSIAWLVLFFQLWMGTVGISFANVDDASLHDAADHCHDAEEQAIHDFMDSADADGATNLEGEYHESGDRRTASGHFSYTDRNGNQHELAIERNIMAVEGAERDMAFHGGNRIDVRHSPDPRSVDLAGMRAPDLGRTDQPTPSGSDPKQNNDDSKNSFAKDREQIRDFRNVADRANPDHGRAARESRSELDHEIKQNSAAAESSANRINDLSAEFSANVGQTVGKYEEFDPDLRGRLHDRPDDEPVGGNIVEIDPSILKKAAMATLKDIFAAGSQAANEIGLNAVDQAEAIALANEVVDSLGTMASRVREFAKGYKEVLRAGAELSVDIALMGFPVMGVAWGLANVSSVLTRGNTILGTPVSGNQDLALLAIGAIAPVLPMKNIAKALRKASAPLSKAVGGALSRRARFVASKIATTTSKHLAEFLVKAERAQKWTARGLRKLYRVERLEHMAASYEKLEPKIAAEAGKKMKVNEVRAIRKEWVDVQGNIHTNTVEDVFRINSSNSAQNHRYSLPGNEAMYSATGEHAAETVLKEVDAPVEHLISDTRVSTYDRVLDLTDPEVVDRIGVSKASLVDETDYSVTHQIGDIAQKNGFDGIKAPSAVDQPAGENMIQLGE